MYVNNIEPEMVLPPGSKSFNHNATRTTSSRSRSNNVNNNTVCVYMVECVHGISRLLAEKTRFTASSACGAVTIRACIRLLYCIIQTNEQTNKQLRLICLIHVLVIKVKSIFKVENFENKIHQKRTTTLT